jgi:hypothetical protein
LHATVPSPGPPPAHCLPFSLHGAAASPFPPPFPRPALRSVAKSEPTARAGLAGGRGGPAPHPPHTHTPTPPTASLGRHDEVVLAEGDRVVLPACGCGGWGKGRRAIAAGQGGGCAGPRAGRHPWLLACTGPLQGTLAGQHVAAAAARLSLCRACGGSLRGKSLPGPDMHAWHAFDPGGPFTHPCSCTYHRSGSSSPRPAAPRTRAGAPPSRWPRPANS